MTTTTPVRALTVRQPWANAITNGTKRVENRTWGTGYRGWLLIHAGMTVDAGARSLPLLQAVPIVPWGSVRGSLVALARLVDVHQDDGCAGGRCSQWAEPGVWHWVLDTAVYRLSTPVLCPGARKLWTPPEYMLARPEVARVLADAVAAERRWTA